MPAATKKRPPMEMEPGEGKAHEMGESPTEETREGAEPDDAPKSTNRKRSAKNAKNTKAPMDSDCGCGGKKGASCDGDCGKKMGRNDALTPQEYLSACELGIQGRSRAYIKARLDVAERQDQKCGASGIPDNAKCNKGSGGVGNAVKTGLALAAAGGAGYAAYKLGAAAVEDKRRKVHNANVRAKRPGNAALRAGKAYMGFGAYVATGNQGFIKDKSIYADGFTPDLAQLAL